MRAIDLRTKAGRGFLENWADLYGLKKEANETYKELRRRIVEKGIKMNLNIKRKRIHHEH